MGGAADGPAHHGHRAAAAGLSLCFVVVSHSPSRSGSLPCLRGDSTARRRVFSSVLCAARGQRVLRGTEWTLCAPIGCVALHARRVRFWRRARLSDRRACDPNPSYTAHARAAASAVRCARCCVSLLRVAVLRAPARRSVGGAAGRALPFASLRSGSRGSAGYLVDPASSHMLVSKIKPCMSKYKRLVL